MANVPESGDAAETRLPADAMFDGERYLASLRDAREVYIYGERVRDAIGTGKVVVGDDQVDSETLRSFGGREGADAHVNANDQVNARRSGALDHVIAHVVAFAKAVRHVEVGGAAAEFNCGLQNNDRHGAICVVVAVDEHGFFTLDGGIDAINRGAQARHALGGMQMRKGRRKIAVGRIQIVDAAVHQQWRQDICCLGLFIFYLFYSFYLF